MSDNNPDSTTAEVADIEILRDEVTAAIYEYRKTYPEPYALSSNLDLAVRAIGSQAMSAPEVRALRAEVDESVEDYHRYPGTSDGLYPNLALAVRIMDCLHPVTNAGVETNEVSGIVLHPLDSPPEPTGLEKVISDAIQEFRHDAHFPHFARHLTMRVKEYLTSLETLGD